MPSEDTGLTALNEVFGANELTEFWNTLFGCRWIILAVTGIVFLISCIYFSILPNVYTSGVQILVERVDQQRPNTFQEMVMPPFEVEEDYYGTQIAILTGRKIQQAVVDELHLDKKSVFQAQARRIRSTRIISLNVKHKNPQMAATIANKFAEVYLRQNVQDSLFMPKQILKWLPGDSTEMSEKEQSSDTFKSLSKREYAESLKSVANDPIVQKLKNNRLDVEGELRKLSQRYKSQYPAVKELNEKLVYLDAQIEDRTRQVISGLRANLAGEFQITNVKILEEAVPPGKPSEPRRLKGILFNTLFGFFLSCLLVLIMEYTNQKIRTEDDCGTGLHVPFLGCVPLVEELLNNKHNRNGNRANGQRDLLFVEVFKRNGELSDALASLRTRLLYSMPFEKSKRIMITSCIPDEGKSTICALLAFSFANMGERVLLISSDIRRPFLSQYLGVQSDKGLTDFLVGAVSSPDEIIYDVPGSNVKLISAGNSSPNPTELLESKRFKELLDKVSPDFDRLIIDVSPVLFIPDGVIIAKHIHSSILICGAGMVHKRVVKNVIKKFEELNHPFTGIVINRAVYHQGAYSYRYKYYKAYQSYYKKETALSGQGATL